MKNNQTILRLLYPQWQGGVISSWFPELSPEEASKGYYLGAKLLNFLAPNDKQKTVEVPISLDYSNQSIEDGIHRKSIILQQTKSALEILENNNPEKIVTLGGECSVSVVPFTYLAKKYPNDLAVVWLDAHPDINIPGDNYTGFHSMAVTACIGMGDEEIINILPAKIDPSKILIAGLSSWDKDAEERLPKTKISTLSPKEIKDNPNTITNWLSKTKVSKVAIHFDLDVLNSLELSAAVDRKSGEMKIKEIIQIIKDISLNYEIVGLTVSEFLPDIEIKLKAILSELPLMN